MQNLKTLERHLIVIICGLPGVGKSTLATHLAPLIDAVILSSDKIRKELFVNPTYKRRERETVYQAMLLLAKYIHQAGKNCILDATFNRESSRMEAKEKVGISEDELFILECHCPEFLIKNRLESKKRSYSDADIAIYNRMKKIYEPVRMKHIDVDTSEIPKDNAKSVASIIKST